MNRKRRKALAIIANRLDDQLAALEPLRDEERELHDNMRESIQESPKGIAADEAATALEEAYEQILQAIECIESATQ